jgi:putative component of toxin-antitoxin plasmid stabilization module
MNRQFDFEQTELYKKQFSEFDKPQRNKIYEKMCNHILGLVDGKMLKSGIKLQELRILGKGGIRIYFVMDDGKIQYLEVTVKTKQDKTINRLARQGY